MKNSILLFLLFVAGMAYGQEVLSPLKYNASLSSVKEQQKTNSLNFSFIYLIDTLSLPIIDDFSRDRFKKYDADTSDANVSDTTWFSLVNGGIPEPWGTKYMSDTTYRYEIDTVPGYGFDSIKIDTVALSPLLIDVYDLSSYPISMTIEEVWPAIYTYDSLWTVTSPDITIIESNPDFEQDSATIYFVAPTSADSQIYWEDNFVFLNNTFPVDPITIGVATFDGIDENGFPYDWSSPSAYGIADYLTSKPIALGSYTPASDIYLSFYYQPGGLGEDPEIQDSLVLEFWSPLTSTWSSVWKAPGEAMTSFQVGIIQITDVKYFYDGFKFRFKNYGTLTGGLDHWHLDYVFLDELRAIDDTDMKDLAFQYEAPSLINSYTSMPWSHYQLVPKSMMKTSTSVKAFNSFSGTKNLNGAFCNIDLFYQGANINTIPYVNTGGDVPGYSQRIMDYTIPTSFWFDTLLADTLATFDVRYTLNTTTTPEKLRVNDTIWQTQLFDNYYSYDDGTAEAAYGLVANGAELAYQFTLPTGLSDTIRSVKMYFAASVNDASLDPFFIQIWNDIGGEPGEIIYTSDDQDIPYTFTPVYNVGVNAFWEYFLPEKVIVNGTFYVGWKQTNSNRLNIGFDKNINNQDKIFYDLGSGWANSVFEGSLMIRPVFTSKKDALYASMSEQKTKELTFDMYPNPANDVLNFSFDDDFKGEVLVFDLQGRLIISKQIVNNDQISLSTVPSGMYVVQITNEQGKVTSKKLSVNK